MKKELLDELNAGGKSAHMKRRLISHFVEHGPTTITDLAKLLMCSIPTVTKFVGELMASDCLRDYGKLETLGGRYPLLYGLNPEAGYFIGVDVKQNAINLGIIDFVGDLKQIYYDIPFELDNTSDKREEICQIILAHMQEAGFKKSDILNVNINLPGRINPEIGQSFTLFSEDQSQTLAKSFTERIGIPVTIDNDTRGMAYGEYTQGIAAGTNVKNLLYINISWGIGLGIILGGKVYLGKSGFSGEMGHISTFDNQILCRCGKRGCLETEVSGLALHRIVLERIKAGEVSVLSERVLGGESITLKDIIQAVQHEDILCLEVLNEMGAKLGRQVASLINIFNPEMVIIGGALSATGDYITQPVQNVVRTYSLSVVNKDTQIVAAHLGERSGVIGACMLARSRRFAVTGRR